MTRWVSTNSPPYPHFITLFFGSAFIVSSVALNQACIEYSDAGTVYANVGGSDVSIGSWTGGTSANLSISVTPTLTASVKFRQTADHAGGFGYTCALEVWAFGTPPPARYLVLGAAGCTSTAIATDADCWSTSSGGLGGAGVPGVGDGAFFDSNSGAGSASLNANMDVLDWCSFSACNGGSNFAGTVNLLTYTITIEENWNSKGGTFTRGTSTVVFEGIGTLATANDGSYGFKDFYNVTIQTGSNVSFTTPIGVANHLIVNGILFSSDPQRTFNVFGVSGTANPVTRGVNGVLSHSGYLFYSIESTSNFNVVGTTYQHLGVRGAPNITATLTGDIVTPACGNSVDCAMIINAIVPLSRFTVKTANFNLTIGGTLFIGDGFNFPVTFFAGSSRIEAAGITPTGPGFSYWETSTIIAHASPDTCGGPYPVCLSFYLSFGAIVYLQGASFTASDAEIHLFEITYLYANATSLNFKVLTVEPLSHLIKDGFDLYNLQISVASGYATIPTWTGFSRPDSVSWKMSISVPSSTVTIYMGNMTPNVDYRLVRDGERVEGATANGIGTVAIITNSIGSGVVTLQIISLAAEEKAFAASIVNAFILFAFMATLVLAVMGAVWLRHRFS